MMKGLLIICKWKKVCHSELVFVVRHTGCNNYENTETQLMYMCLFYATGYYNILWWYYTIMGIRCYRGL